MRSSSTTGVDAYFTIYLVMDGVKSEEGQSRSGFSDCKPKRKRVAVNTLFFPYSRGLLNYSSSSNTLANLPQSSAKPVMSVKPLSDSKESFNDDEVSQSTRLSEFLSSQNGSAFCKSLSAKYHCNASTSLHSLSYCAREPTHFNEIGSNIINTIHSSIHTEISSDAEKVENSSEKNHLVIRFMQLEIVWISDILKSLRALSDRALLPYIKSSFLHRFVSIPVCE
ncbi:unnamed protein product [Dracunculus medinensis]|uniref:CDT1 domain-containing protein n=1 Tax=Dracunculus medinensis TaxID=318479 RepID=A0A0N4U0D6_DRAME|nr:unnamed protein product [Dracunculus medinensis]